MKSFQAEGITSSKRFKDKKAQKKETHPETMRCSAGLNYILGREY